MRVVTIVSLAASAVLGLGALFVAKAVLPNTASAQSAQAPAQGAAVVVATRDIKYGDKLEPAMLTVVRIPKDVVPQGAFTTAQQVLSADRGGPPVALTPITAREPILPTKISGPGARPSVAAAIADGMRAYTIKVTDVSGVGGHALPGDHVDVVLTRDLTPEGPQRNYISQIVLQNVRVLGIDLNADLATEKPASPNTATLEVSVEDAQKLSMASNLGGLSLALRKSGEAEIAQAGPLRTGDFLIGGAPRASGGGGARVQRVAHRPAPAGIVVVEGEPAKGERKVRGKAPPPAAASPRNAVKPAAAPAAMSAQ